MTATKAGKLPKCVLERLPARWRGSKKHVKYWSALTFQGTDNESAVKETAGKEADAGVDEAPAQRTSRVASGDMDTATRDRYDQAYTDLLVKNTQVEARLEAAVAAKVDLRESNRSLKGSVDQLNGKVEQLQAELARANQSKVEADASVARLQDELTRAQDDIAKLKTELTKVQGDNVELTTNVQKLDLVAAKYKRKYKDCKTAREEREKEAKELRDQATKARELSLQLQLKQHVIENLCVFNFSLTYFN